MKRVNFEQLWELTDWDNVAIGRSFNWCLQRMSEYIGQPPINKNVSIEIIDDNYPEVIVHENIFSCWVERDTNQEHSKLKIYKKCGEYLPFVLLRELYTCFLPETIRAYYSVQLIIHFILLEDINFVNKDSKPWKELIDPIRVTKDNLSDDQEESEKYFKNQVHHQSLLKLFFSYCTKNQSRIKPSDHDFASVLFEIYNDYTFKFMQVPDNVEMFRITREIFLKQKSYSSQKDYKELFEEYTSNREISTRLNKTAYATIFKDILNTTIAPSYGVNWSFFGGVVITGAIKFHPLLKKNSVLKVLNRVEFIILKQYNFSSMNNEVLYTAFLPQIYEIDFLGFLNRLKKRGYIVNFSYFKSIIQRSILNGNVWKNFHLKKTLIDFQNPKYDKNLLLETNRVLTSEVPSNIQISIIDFLITDYLRMFSVEGIAFEGPKIRLQLFKTKLQSYQTKFRSLNSKLIAHFDDIVGTTKAKDFFMSFVNKHMKHGFFYVNKLLNDSYTLAIALKDLMNSENGKEIVSVSQIGVALKNGNAFLKLSNNLILTNPSMKNLVTEEFLPLLIQDEAQFDNLIKHYYNASEFLSSCADLQIFDLPRILRIVTEFNIAQNIRTVRENKQYEYYDKLKPDSLTDKLITSKLDLFLENGSIIPSIQQTLGTKTTTLILATIRFTDANWELLREFAQFTPICFFPKSLNIDDNTFVCHIQLRMSYLTPIERYQLFSIIYNKFKTDLLYLKLIKGGNLLPFVTLRKYFDFPLNKYFYAKDLFPNLLGYAKKEFGNKLLPIIEKPTALWSHLFSKDVSMVALIKKTHKRIKATAPLEFNALKDLRLFAQTIDASLKHPHNIKQITSKSFFKNHLKAIKFIPVFSFFGLAQYHLYFYPSDVDRIDFRLLLNDSFQSLKNTIGVDTSLSFLIKYIYPYNSPNMSYINKATKTLKIVREYCAFRLTRVYFNFNVDRTITSKHWKVDPNDFEIFAQEIIHQDSWERPPKYLKECNLEVVSTTIYGPDSEEFKTLQRIYGRKPIDLKKNLFFKNNSKIKDFSNLFSKGLLCPYVKFKNLGLYEKVRFILPNITNRAKDKLLRIFTFFNCCEVYEIAGQLFVQGLENEIVFDNGLYVKLYLTGYNTGSVEHFDTINALIEILQKCFEILGVEHYITLNNVLKPESFLDYALGEDADLNGYSPLLNLEWDEENKIYLNHKLYDEANNPVYPSLQETEKNFPV